MRVKPAANNRTRSIDEALEEMRIIRSPKQMFQASRKLKAEGKTIGFVPTMGALHAGHLSLMRKAHKDCDVAAVSIFVNPMQFGPKEDYKRYPRNLKQDSALCKEAGVDIIFYPEPKAMYPRGHATYVNVSGLSEVLCARSRPGHFRGVATVVTKLFNIVEPDIAYFGQKDAQQTVIIKRMVSDLDIPVRIKVMPTVRESNGLALSSRNAYLDANERKDALALYRSLMAVRALISSGTKDTKAVIRMMKKIIQEKETAKIDYISIVRPDTLKPLKKLSGASCLIALAVWIGKTRLIDNIIINLKVKSQKSKVKGKI